MQFSDVFAPATTASDNRLRHDAQIKTTIKYPDGKKVVDILTPQQLEGRLLTLGCLYNVSGYYNPDRPTVRIKILNGRLKQGKLCDCIDCIAT